MPDKLTVFLSVGSVLSSFPHWSLEFLDSFQNANGWHPSVDIPRDCLPIWPFRLRTGTDCEVFESKSYKATAAESCNEITSWAFLLFANVLLGKISSLRWRFINYSGDKSISQQSFFFFWLKHDERQVNSVFLPFLFRASMCSFYRRTVQKRKVICLKRGV